MCIKSSSTAADPNLYTTTVFYLSWSLYTVTLTYHHHKRGIYAVWYYTCSSTIRLYTVMFNEECKGSQLEPCCSSSAVMSKYHHSPVSHWDPGPNSDTWLWLKCFLLLHTLYTHTQVPPSSFSTYSNVSIVYMGNTSNVKSNINSNSFNLKKSLFMRW